MEVLHDRENVKLGWGVYVLSTDMLGVSTNKYVG